LAKKSGIFNTSKHPQDLMSALVSKIQ